MLKVFLFNTCIFILYECLQQLCHIFQNAIIRESYPRCINAYNRSKVIGLKKFVHNYCILIIIIILLSY